MSLDSKAFFESRVRSLGLGDILEEFVKLGWSTLSQFAFAANHAPGRADETAFVNDVIIPLLGNEKDPRKAIVRRLFFESYSLMAADMARRAERPSDEARPVKLPLVERHERLVHLEAELVGLNLRGVLEPSNLLVDRFTEMVDTGEVKYVKWEEYQKKSAELSGFKKDDHWKEDSDGRLRKVQADSEEQIDIRDLLLLKQALQRRGVAMNLARLMSFRKHESIVERFFEELSREHLPGYAQLSMDQIRRADKELFVQLADKTRAGLPEVTGDGKLPLDDLVEAVLSSHRFNALLFPLPATYSKSKENGGRAPGSGEDKRKADPIDQLQRPLKSQRESGSGTQATQKSKGRDAGKSREGKGRKSKVSMPKELIGMMSAWKGERICYSYNLAGCSEKGVERCSKGLHVCCFPGCGGPHSLKDCPKKEKGKR